MAQSRKQSRKSMRLKVALNGALVGYLDRTTSGAISFAYDHAWLADEQRTTPISLSIPLSEELYLGQEVLFFFDNLLPDNDQIKRSIARRTGADGIDAFSLLAKIGGDCVGALQFLSEDSEISSTDAQDYTPLRESEVAQIIRDLPTAPLGIGALGDRDLRISIAGMQEKTALFWDSGWHLPRGTAPTTHILKPALGKLPSGLDMTESVENEHFCLALCREFGLEVARSEIATFEDVRVLVVERFDRLKSADGRWLRLPQEDFCQALGVSSDRKYNSDGGPGIRQCLELLNASDQSEEDRLAFLKAQIVFWLIGAPDGHAKNFSIFLRPQGKYQMTPLYDIMSTQAHYDSGTLDRRAFRFAMAVGDKRRYRIHDILPHHFRQDAKAARIPQSSVDELFHDLATNGEGAVQRALSSVGSEVSTGIAARIADGVQRKVATLVQAS